MTTDRDTSLHLQSRGIRDTPVSCDTRSITLRVNIPTNLNLQLQTTLLVTLREDFRVAASWTNFVIHHITIQYMRSVKLLRD